jgi:hypothetical protein
MPLSSMRVVLVLWLALVSVACNKSSTPSSQGPVTRSSELASRDYTKPYLTEEKMQKFVQSLSEAQNPFEGMFAAGRTSGSIPGQVAALDAFARKYGFQGYQDYVAVWGRIAVGEALIMSEGMKKSVREMTEKTIQSAEEQLKNPSLSPEMRKVYEEQVTSGKKSLQELDKPSDTQLNDSDLALVRKYAGQINEASQKYRKQGIPSQ